MSIKELLIIHHSHYDLGYTHPQPVIQSLTRRFLDDALDLCDRTDDHPDEARSRWTCEVTQPVLDWLAHASARRREQFARRVSEGRIAVGALPFHLTALLDLPELADRLAPLRTLREEFGIEINTAVQNDVNGLLWPVVGLLRDAGVENLMMGINVHYGRFPFRRPNFFRWIGPSEDDSLVVFNGEHYNAFNRETGRRGAPCRPPLESMEANLRHYLERIVGDGYQHDFAVLTATHPDFDDNNPPDFDLPDLVRDWNAAGLTPRLRLVIPSEVFARLQQSEAVLDGHRGDWTDYWTFGAGSTALETAVARRTRHLLRAAHTLACTNPAGRSTLRSLDQAAHDLALFHEHTWGAWCSTGAFFAPFDIEPIPTTEQKAQKSVLAWRAHSLSTMALRDGLEAAAGNPPTGANSPSLLFFNPGDQVVRRPFLVPTKLLDGSWQHFSSAVHRLDVDRWFLFDADHVAQTDDTPAFLRTGQAAWVGPVDLPPHSLHSVPVTELPKAPIPPTTICRSGHLESEHHHMVFDPDSGEIHSLVDKHRGMELVDKAAAWSFFQAVRETIASPSRRAVATGDIRETFMELDFERWHRGEDCWNPNWKSIHEGPGRTLSCTITATPEGPSLVRELEMPGFSRFVQTITLIEADRAVRLATYGVKTEHSEPEGIYLALPLALGNPRYTFETAGQPVRYHIDQLPGSCRDHITTDTWVAVEGDEGAAILASPDVPFFQFGGFTFGRCRKEPVDHPRALILAWPMNNYWNTNFPATQPGPVRWSLELSTVNGLDHGEAAAFARRVTTPVMVHPVVGPTSSQGTRIIVEVEGSGLRLASLATAPEEPGVLLARIHNAGDHAIPGQLRLTDPPLDHAFLAKPTGRPVEELDPTDGTIRFVARPAGLTTLRLEVMESHQSPRAGNADIPV